MKPALTPEEWARGTPDCPLGVFGWDDGSVFIDWREGEKPTVERPHAVAAALLHGQPFGFTREDLDTLAKLVLDAKTLPTRLFKDVDNLAGRIAALLPPEFP